MYNDQHNQIEPSKDQPKQSISKNSLFFVLLIILWQIAAIIIYGLFFGYNETISTATSTSLNQYLNIYLIMAFFIFIIAGILYLMKIGLTLTSAYVTFSSSVNMTFSILVSLFTLQNWFIYRCFWHKTGLPLQPMSSSFNGERYNEISFIPQGNLRAYTSDYFTASFYDAIGACIAMFCALTPILGRIGFLQVFVLSWVGPFFYEINSSIFNKFFIVDTGFGMRGFLFGGMLGLWLSLIMGKRVETKEGGRFMSHYHINAMCLIGGVLICLAYPSLVSTGMQLTSNGFGPTIAATVQINMWLAVAGSIVGVFTANSLTYRKINVHDVIFASLAGAIAFSSSSTINFNPGAAIAIGSSIGFICALIHTPLKRWMNDGGVLESNSVIVQFIIPGCFAVIFSSILQAIFQGNYNITISNANQTTIDKDISRNPSEQAGWQLMGFVFSLGSSLICGVVIGLLFRTLQRHRSYWYFNDLRWFDYGEEKREVYREE